MLFHPLSGSDPATLLAVLRANRPIPARHWHKIALALGASIGRLPFSLIERAVVPSMLKKLPPMPPPIFILGHWRSGTTHLYNTMTRAGRFGYVPPLATGLPWDMLVLARLLRPFLKQLLPNKRYIDSIPVALDSPQEDEAALANMQPLSFYHGLYFPRRLREHFMQGVFLEGCAPQVVADWEKRFTYFMNKLHILNAGRPLLIKNPVYTARVAQLRTLYPQAKFIHMHRDPLRVFLSMRNFYRKLIDAMALQDHDPAIIDELILETYPIMMDRLIEQTASLPQGSCVEIAYDDLDRQPLEQIHRIYESLGIEGYGEDEPAFKAYLDSIRQYEKNTFDLPQDVAEKVRKCWGAYIQRYGSTTAA